MSRHLAIYFWLSFSFMFFSFESLSQLSGTYSIPGSYSTLYDAVNDINTLGVSGHVVFEISSGHTEAAPAGGIILQFAPWVPSTNYSNSSQTITFQKSGIGSNPLISAYTGTQNVSSATSFDGIIKIIGCDYVTFDGIDLAESTGNVDALTWMEFGYGLLRTSNIDGTQNCTIKNCTITMNSAHSGSWTGLSGASGSVGILSAPITNSSTTPLSIVGASLAGTNSQNTFIGNTINNTTIGIYFRGFNDVSSPYAYYDQSNEIGNAVSGGNLFQNFKLYGIYCIYQNNVSILQNTIDNDASTGTAATSSIYGIYHDISINTSPEINFNIIRINLGSFTGYCAAICESTSGTGNTTISNNEINITGGSTSSAISCYGILRPNVSASKSNVTIENNIFYGINFSYMSTGVMGVFYLFYNNTNAISNTVFSNNSLSGSSVPYLTLTTGNACSGYGYVNTSASSATGNVIIENNSFTNIQTNNTATFYAFNESVGNTVNSLNKTISGNLISNISLGGGTFLAISCSKAGGSANIFNNTIQNINGASTAWGMNVSSNSNVNVYENRITDFTTTAQYKGIYISSQSYGSVYNNIIRNMSAINNSACHGILTENIAATMNVFNNIIYNLTSSGTPTVAIIGIETNTNGTAGIIHNVYNNLVTQISINSGITSTITPSIIGISAKRSSQNIYNNTVALGFGASLTSGGNFGVTGILYAANTGALDLRNNIIYVNASPAGTGLVSCLQRASGTSGTAPTNFSSSSNYNIYYSPVSSNSYLYSEGTTVSTAVNSYNLSNDPEFSSVPMCSLYKQFMTTGGEDSTTTENIPFNGVGSDPLLKYELNSAIGSYAESGGETIALVSTDINNLSRPNNLITNRPDIGCIEYTGVEKNIVVCPLVLPVELISFDGENLENKNHIFWKTISETNNAYFILEKSKDGVHWNSISQIEGKGTTNEASSYEYFDENNISNISYYRLLQVDFDGNSTPSQIIAISNEDYSNMIVYPNPSSDIVYVNCGKIVPSVNIYNYNGDLVLTSNSFSIDISKLSKGIYLLKTVVNEKIHLFKIEKI